MRINNIVYVKRRTNRSGRIFLLIPVLILLIVIAIAAVSVFNGLSLIHPDRIPLTVAPPASIGSFQNVSFINTNGDYELKGWYFKSLKNKGNIVLVHGYDQNRLPFGDNTFTLIKKMLEAGYNVLAFDLRNSGESAGEFTSMGYYEKYDVISAVEWMRQQRQGKTALLSFSTGASAALLAAAECADIDAVIADTPFSDLQSFLNRHLAKWSPLPSFPFNSTITLAIEVLCRMDASEVSPQKSLQALAPRPVMFIHSRNDASIPLEDNIPMYETYIAADTGESSVWYTDYDGHVQSCAADPEGYSAKIASFLKEALAQ